MIEYRAQEDNNIAGNYYDKYHTKNPIARKLMNGFLNSFIELAQETSVKTVYEFGCGEGELSRLLVERGITVTASDVDRQIVDHAIRTHTNSKSLTFETQSLYTFEPDKIDAEMVVCCEVLEHLESPECALARLTKLDCNYLLLSVPREPIWRILNISRGKYLKSLGNTPGHLQHWSKRDFIGVVTKYFDIVQIKSPFPWTMVLCKNRK